MHKDIHDTKISETLAQAQEIPEDLHSSHQQQDLIDIKVNMQEKYDTNILGTINHDSFETKIVNHSGNF